MNPFVLLSERGKQRRQMILVLKMKTKNKLMVVTNAQEWSRRLKHLNEEYFSNWPVGPDYMLEAYSLGNTTWCLPVALTFGKAPTFGMMFHVK